jgi:hypothetical protein
MSKATGADQAINQVIQGEMSEQPVMSITELARGACPVGKGSHGVQSQEERLASARTLALGSSFFPPDPWLDAVRGGQCP